jgi:hypothetical protein
LIKLILTFINLKTTHLHHQNPAEPYHQPFRCIS